MTKLISEKVRFNDGTFGVRQKKGDSYRYCSVSGGRLYWYTRESDIEHFCHMEEKDADYAMAYEFDPGNVV